ncbi:MAG: hypothetical protein H6636_01095 [Anaerolineales bacterium]|nr:hypothetical protein [Anaerolineales bacterium]
MTCAPQRIVEGMGLIALHSAHFSKILLLMGTTCNLEMARNRRKERLWVVNPHPHRTG